MKFLKKRSKNADSRLHLDNKINIFPKCKRSQSEVISTILLVLIAIVAITIVSMFAINFVNNQIEKSKCIEVLNPALVEIKNNPLYTCFDNTNSVMKVQVHFSETKSLLEGFVIELGGADTQTFRILNNTLVDRVSMSSGQEAMVVLPSDNADRTYNISAVTIKPEKLNAYPILKGGKVCESSKVIGQIPLCK